ncbi:Cytochrome C oxidase, cbb3-type, subunit III [Spongiibacter sp. IMCC21906]|jgi:cytochrome c5|uniref:c-type cytochrome n=1 Tax=Spongiibacter sp. IMCC21906 TaxID=1620392 RepID=UPI00062DDBEA|nr:c-type cytochrome [Spongiibacter sp. IMCC21906]AKH68189.1 Cytochrome C oxidase, cbb3-type, subunit III [Spongiibacter sp. IMCC21906]
MKKILMAVSVLVMASAAGAEDRDLQALYKKSCFACHAYGANNAPKTGAADQWAPRLEKGMETLVAHARDGFNTMPPKGLCFDCSDAEFKALIEFMSEPQQ